MHAVAAAAAWLVATVLALPTLCLLLEVVAASRGRRPIAEPETAPGTVRPTLAVLMPAHDESAGIGAALRSVFADVAPGDRVLVVADNCSDRTADIARAAGAEVVERADPSRRGKGYALDFGVRRLEAAPPDIVVVVDADCAVHRGSLDLLARACAGTGRPAQALYLMHAPPGAGLRLRIGAFAWIVKNHVRPLGAAWLGWPCQLLGTGMAFPWPLLRDADLASSHLVEDMRLGLDLGIAGAAPLFVPEALVSSDFPLESRGAAEQRARWERGHLSMIAREVPRALAVGVARGRPPLMAMALDMAVPPLSVLAVALTAQLVIDAALVAIGAIAVGPFVVAALSWLGLALAVVIAWRGFGRTTLSSRELAGAPFYVAAKLPMYLRFLMTRNAGWVRTRRDPPEK